MKYHFQKTTLLRSYVPWHPPIYLKCTIQWFFLCLQTWATPWQSPFRDTVLLSIPLTPSNLQPLSCLIYGRIIINAFGQINACLLMSRIINEQNLVSCSPFFLFPILCICCWSNRPFGHLERFASCHFLSFLSGMWKVLGLGLR